MTHPFARPSRPRRPSRALSGAAGLAVGSLLLAACGSAPHAAAPGRSHHRTGTTSTTAATSTTVAAATTTTTASPPGASGTTGSSGTTGTSGASGTTTTTTTTTLVPVNGNVAQCATGHLGFALGSSSGSAGSVDVAVVLTNTGSLPCYLYGYPGVSAVAGPNGPQLGQAAERATQLGPPAVVTLQPGGKANADLHVVDALNFPSATCHPTAAAGFKVFPPGDTTAGFASSSSLQVCTADVPHALAVGPVTAGASSSVNGG